jgi:hypothetical protein
LKNKKSKSILYARCFSLSPIKPSLKLGRSVTATLNKKFLLKIFKSLHPRPERRGFHSFVILNPAIVQATGMPFAALMTTTILVTIIFTFFVGIYARVPFVQSVYMGEKHFLHLQ